MTSPFARFVALLLVLMQACLAISPARIVCIPTGSCEQHPSHDDDHPDNHCGTHEHGATPLIGHDHPECGCHLHVSMTGTREALTRPKVRIAESTSLDSIPAAPTDDSWSRRPPPLPRSAAAGPPDSARSARTLSLRATRMLV